MLCDSDFKLCDGEIELLRWEKNKKDGRREVWREESRYDEMRNEENNSSSTDPSQSRPALERQAGRGPRPRVGAIGSNLQRSRPVWGLWLAVLSTRERYLGGL